MTDEKKIDDAVKIIKESSNTVVFTGAGHSTESGIADFRSEGGLWSRYDPAIYAVRQMVYTDSVNDPWFAPAGYRRGRLTKPTDVEVKLNQGIVGIVILKYGKN